MALKVSADKTRSLIILLLALVALKGVFFTAMLPAWEGDDETSYWADIRSVSGESQSFAGTSGTEHGRLYPVLAAPIYLGLRPLKLEHRLFAVRLLGVALMVVTVFLAFTSAKQLWPGSPFVQLGAALLVAFNPKLTFVMASVSSDVLLISLFSAFMVALTAFILRPTKLAGVAMTAIVIAGILTKKRFSIALPILALAVLALGIEWLLKTAFYEDQKSKVITAAGVLAFAVWQFWPRLLGMIGSLSGRTTNAAFIFNRDAVALWAQPFWRTRMWRQFWGFFTWHGGIYFSNGIYRVLFWLTALAACGLALRIYQASSATFSLAGDDKESGGGFGFSVRPPSFEEYRRSLALALSGVAIGFTLTAVAAYELSGSSALGRYLLIGVVPISLLSAAGLEAVLPERARTAALLLLTAGLMFLNALAVTAFLMPRFYS